MCDGGAERSDVPGHLCMNSLSYDVTACLRKLPRLRLPVVSPVLASGRIHFNSCLPDSVSVCLTIAHAARRNVEAIKGNFI